MPKVLTKEEALKMTPEKCYLFVGKPKSAKLDAKMREYIIDRNRRLISANYSNPLLKNHTSMAVVKYIDESGCVGGDYFMV